MYRPMKNFRTRASKEFRESVINEFFSSELTYRELASKYNLNASTLASWVSRYGIHGNVVSLPPKSNASDDMPGKKKDTEQSPEIAQLQARIRELEMQNLALNTLIDVAEEQGLCIRKKTGAKQ